MKNILAILAVTGILSGCYVTPYGGEVYWSARPLVVQPEIAVGFYDPAFGYWTGTGWDVNFYAYGHGGYGHPVYHGGRYAPHGVVGHPHH
jgi:hypothetical protein